MKKISLYLLGLIIFIVSACDNNSKKDNEQQNQEETIDQEETDEEDYAENYGVVKLQIEDKTFDWVCIGSFTTKAIRDSSGEKSLQFDYLDLDYQSSEGSLVVEKTLTIRAEWKDGNEYLEVGEYRAAIGFKNVLSEGYMYVNNPNIENIGTVKIDKVTKINDAEFWIEGRIECPELSILKGEEGKPANSTTIKMRNLKLEINNICRINK